MSTNETHPISNIMRDVSACVSGIGIEKRSHIQKLVELMGGSWTAKLMEYNTHLITNSILTQKCQVAFEMQMKIVTEDWVMKMFKLAQDDTTNDIEELQTYKLPLFYNLNITSTGFYELAKTELIGLIKGNGGTYSGSFESSKTDVLISPRNCLRSEKFQAAVKCSKIIVTADWIYDSVKNGYGLSFAPYRIDDKTDEQQSVPTAPTSSSNPKEKIEKFLEEITFAVFGFTDESSIEVQNEIKSAGGVTIEEFDFSTTVDYLVVPVDIYDLTENNHKFTEIVTQLWIGDCLSASKLVNLEYYHRPLMMKEQNQPLRQQKIVFSEYRDSERAYLMYVVEALGGSLNERFVRKEDPILICPTPTGEKYNAAIKWKLPVVRGDWLIHCFTNGKRLPLTPYLVEPDKSTAEILADLMGPPEEQPWDKPSTIDHSGEPSNSGPPLLLSEPSMMNRYYDLFGHPFNSGLPEQLSLDEPFTIDLFGQPPNSGPLDEPSTFDLFGQPPNSSPPE